MTPETETFSTPPTTPMPPPTTTRRPSQLQFTSESELHAEIQLELDEDHNTPHLKSSPLPKALQGALKSPCFVHSLLDKGVSLGDWLKQNQGQQQPQPMPSPPVSGSSSEPDYEDDEDEYSSSLTRQLAETAVGVREMSKQLGRARVHSKINNVLIITKARDNRLIKLTRELALMLMRKEREDGRGHVVYVDSQLRNSKRFDAAGMERDYPELFEPLPPPRRRSSSSTSVASGLSSLRMTAVSSRNSSTDNLPLSSEGQLRYWTSDMCIRSPHLFDFVVTLGGDGTVLFASWLFQRIVPPILPFALGSLGFLTNFDFADYKAVMDGAIDNGIRVNLRMRFSCTVYRAVNPGECGSLVHPEIPAILITPICPHTLSFRPMLLPDSMELRVCVPYNSRSTAWASFDGRGRVELKPGDHIKVTASKFPFPTVCNDKQSTDWFHSISRTFKWNERERQKSFVMVEEDAPASQAQLAKRGQDEEEEEEKYDIDDSSPEAATSSTANSPPGPVASSIGEPKGIGAAAVAARAINRDNIVESHFTNKSGYDSPDRFRVAQPHPPKVHFRHTVEGAPQPQEAPRSAGEAKTPRPGDAAQTYLQHASIEQDGRPHSAGIQHHHHHSPHYPHSKPQRERAPATAPHDRRAFAVWGQDESDSNTSDGEL
ncbi:hypothetical protein FRC11_000332 [Ceratobasidium sp. 423]|nr:hypothetical protein FRC11_000332 [Ceratobasidium sp. 423]